MPGQGVERHGQQRHPRDQRRISRLPRRRAPLLRLRRRPGGRGRRGGGERQRLPGFERPVEGTPARPRLRSRPGTCRRWCRRHGRCRCGPAARGTPSSSCPRRACPGTRGSGGACGGGARRRLACTGAGAGSPDRVWNGSPAGAGDVRDASRSSRTSVTRSVGAAGAGASRGDFAASSVWRTAATPSSAGSCPPAHLTATSVNASAMT